MATQIVGSLMALEAMDEEEEIRMYINSPGGQPYSIFGVLDAMATIKPPIQTLGLGACYSYASLILVGWSCSWLCDLAQPVSYSSMWLLNVPVSLSKSS
jgi:ATP-dependent protease ClpP protease subunit